METPLGRYLPILLLALLLFLIPILSIFVSRLFGAKQRSVGAKSETSEKIRLMGTRSSIYLAVLVTTVLFSICFVFIPIISSYSLNSKRASILILIVAGIAYLAMFYSTKKGSLNWMGEDEKGQ